MSEGYKRKVKLSVLPNGWQCMFRQHKKKLRGKSQGCYRVLCGPIVEKKESPDDMPIVVQYGRTFHKARTAKRYMKRIMERPEIDGQSIIEGKMYPVHLTVLEMQEEELNVLPF